MPPDAAAVEPAAPAPARGGAGRATVAAMTAAFGACEREAQRMEAAPPAAATVAATEAAAVDVPLAPFVAACGSTIDLYAHVFSPGSFIARVLGRTTTRHMACVTAAAAVAAAAADPAALPRPQAPLRLRAVLARERDARGVESVRWDRSSACHTAMWLSRGLFFCQSFMDLMANGDGSGTLPGPRACASAAYDRALRPFHGLLLSTVFRAALSYAPAERDELFRAFGYTDVREGEARVRECVDAMRPVTRRVHRLIVDEGLDFHDVVSPMRGALK
jgi:hypothetical protein